MAQLTVLGQRLRRRLDVADARDRLAAQARTTPGRLNLYLAALLVLGVLAGLAAVIGAGQRADAVSAVATSSGPLAVRAQGLYRSLSDADTTAATSFLSGATPSPADRSRYDDDIASAGAALSAITVDSDAERALLAQVSTNLPVYTGLVSTAQANNRQGNPVAAAYLKEASTLMRGTILPAANQLYQAASSRLDADRSDGAAFPWFTVLLIGLTLAALVIAQRFLVERTQRLVNVGLVVASAAGALLLIWVVVSWAVVAGNLHAGDRDGSAQVRAVAQVRIDALQARADEALTLIARGNGADFEKDYQQLMGGLVGPDGHGGTLGAALGAADQPEVRSALSNAQTNLLAWRDQHTQVRKDDDGNNYPDAVKLALGDAATTFASLDTQLQHAITDAEATFNDRAASADDALTATTVGWILLTLVLIAGLVVGLEQRIAEYR
jgi:hypothetical protein